MLLFGVMAIATAHAELGIPIRQAHAHNDYEHAHPLFDALDQGFCSVEADVYLVDGQLLVAHNRKDCRPEKNLEALYLHPLQERVQRAGGVYPGLKDFSLWIDIKVDPAKSNKNPEKVPAVAAATANAVHQLLKKYSSILTAFEELEVKTNAVTVILTGAHPKAWPSENKPRLACFDSASITTVTGNLELAFSENWTHLFAWRGEGVMSQDEKKKLRELVQGAHRAGKRVRFWATPETPIAWKELLDAKVDWIGTDRLKELAKYLKTADKSSLTTK